MSEIVSDAWKEYLHQLQLHPLRTKAITAGVLAGCSDAIAQKITGIKKLQLRRLLLIMLYGFAYGGPFGHFLHKLMDIIFKGKKDNKTVAKKVLLEQLTSSPWNNMLFMTYYGLVIEGRPWSLVRNKIRKDYPSVQLTAWKFWPIVGWVNYQYMPLQIRVVFHSFVASCWCDLAKELWDKVEEILTLKATWSDSEESSSTEGEVQEKNVGFMAIEDNSPEGDLSQS